MKLGLFYTISVLMWVLFTVHIKIHRLENINVNDRVDTIYPISWACNGFDRVKKISSAMS